MTLKATIYCKKGPLVGTRQSSARSKLPKELPDKIQQEPATNNDKHHDNLQETLKHTIAM
jgi:hypothetical protein